jgi:vacuolar-type H+-ATPase subunit F/Vma7
MVVVVGRPGDAVRWALAGREVWVTADARAAAQALARLLDEAEVAAVAVPQDLFESLPDELRRRAAASERPRVVALPASRAEVPPSDAA